jgi:hypothetical protein
MQLATARMPRKVWQQSKPLAAVQRPPGLPGHAGGLSGRPTCRIYRGRDAWVLEFENGSGGWIEPVHSGRGDEDSGLKFPTLVAAIGYAERYGLEYRIVPAPAQRSITNRNGLPRSWSARLSRNGRNGDIYRA